MTCCVILQNIKKRIPKLIAHYCSGVWSCSLQPGRHRLQPDDGSVHSTLRNAGIMISRVSDRSNLPRLCYRLLVVVVAMMVSTIPDTPGAARPSTLSYRAHSAKFQVVFKYPVDPTDSVSEAKGHGTSDLSTNRRLYTIPRIMDV